MELLKWRDAKEMKTVQIFFRVNFFSPDDFCFADWLARAGFTGEKSVRPWVADGLLHQ